MALSEISALTESAGRQGHILGVHLPTDDEGEEPWLTPLSRQKPDILMTDPLPETVDVVLGDQIYIDRTGLPAVLA